MTRIEHFALFASDIESLKRFYEEAFGLRVVLDNSKANPAGYFLADEGGSVLEIIARPGQEDPVRQRYVCHIAFQVDDVGSSRQALERRGLVFETETAVDTPGMKTAFFNDPEGNRCQIVWRRNALAEKRG